MFQQPASQAVGDGLALGIANQPAALPGATLLAARVDAQIARIQRAGRLPMGGLGERQASALRDQVLPALTGAFATTTNWNNLEFANAGLAPLAARRPLRRVVVSTYQAASGAGAAAMRELETQTAAILAGNAPEPEIFPHPIAFNLFSHNTAIDETGYNEEELKMVKETRKILSDDSLAVTATCIRVPIPRAHSESVNIEFMGERPSVAAIQSALAAFPGVVVVDDREANVFPMPLYASGRDEVFVGRIREDISCPNAIDLFLSGDQILKGAALNGYQIAECLIERGLLGGKK